MCGRTACCRCSNDYKKATGYFNDKTGKFEQPNWIQHANSNLEFKPSSNLAPTEAVPVLISGKHCDNSSEQILQPMIWSLIPNWHKGDYNKHGLSTNNARLEGLAKSRLYSNPLKKGQRCVVISDGFYEWKKDAGAKQPYFIYVKQDEGMKVEEASCWEKAVWGENKGWNGPEVLKMAGVFDIWTSPKGEVVPNCTIITMESNKHFSWLHERMPAVLDSEEAVKEWLDVERNPLENALNALKPTDKLHWHPVTTKMGNSRYKEADSCKPINLNKRPNEKGSSALMSWLKTGSMSPSAKKKKSTD
ncbi:abasic site processing protein HMCES [Lycorma delicatula]|uniref:abasic site processing protein HMCES n=1 Tax=Lycorma delicatula TaxID=130591 RepID=UPI003F512C22